MIITLMKHTSLDIKSLKKLKEKLAVARSEYSIKNAEWKALCKQRDEVNNKMYKLENVLAKLSWQKWYLRDKVKYFWKDKMVRVASKKDCSI